MDYNIHIHILRWYTRCADLNARPSTVEKKVCLYNCPSSIACCKYSMNRHSSLNRSSCCDLIWIPISLKLCRLYCWCMYFHRASIGLNDHDDVIKWKHFPRYWPFVRGIHRSPVNLLTKASDAELSCFLCSAPEHTVQQTFETRVIWDSIALYHGVMVMSTIQWFWTQHYIISWYIIVCIFRGINSSRLGSHEWITWVVWYQGQ